MLQLSKLSALLFVATLALVGCAPSPEAAPEVSENPYGGFPVDPPGSDEIVLTLIGSESLDFSLDDLRGFPTTTITVLEPFVNESVTFEGVSLAYLFERAGITLDSDVDTVALNEYRFRDLAQSLVDADGLIAFSEDGGPIAMDRGGPVRIVFAEDSDYFTYLDAWNWSLRTIEEATD